MIHARASVFDFINSKVITDLAGLCTPDITAALVVPGEPPKFPNVLNVNLYDDTSIMTTNPAWRKLVGTLELFIEKADSSAPEIAENVALRAMHLINNFLAIQQTCQKKDFGQIPPKYLGSNVGWRDSYPLNWKSSFLRSDRYVHKKAAFTAKYFEEKYQ